MIYTSKSAMYSDTLLPRHTTMIPSATINDQLEFDVHENQMDTFRYLSNGTSSAYSGINLPDNYVSTFGDSLENTTSGAEIDIIPTHCAYLFLGHPVVYKIKRIVQYSYLDTRNIDDRRQLCERELELNQHLLPAYYIDTVTITLESNGSLAINGEGSTIEWAVRMKRFEEQNVLENIATSGQLTEELARTLAESVAQFHNALGPELVSDGYQRMYEIVNELVIEFSQLNNIIPSRQTREFETLVSAHLEGGRNQLDDRARNGYVRRCHGDLHLRNIVLIDGQPIPFDALEFNERLGTCDILYYFAFLLMDVGKQDLYTQQNQLLNTYLLNTDIDNTQSLNLLRLFLSCRAAIKAMTTAQAAILEHDSEESGQLEASDYLSIAIGYLSSSKPSLIAIGGLSGSGKSAIAIKLSAIIARPPGAVLIHSDNERKVAAGVPLHHTIPFEQYTTAASVSNYKLLAFKAHAALSAGFTVIVDATFLKSLDRINMEDIAHKLCVPFVGIWLNATAETLRARVVARRNDVSDASLGVLETQLQIYDAPSDWTTFDSARHLELLTTECFDHVCACLSEIEDTDD